MAAASSIDPDFARALAEAREKGVRLLARHCHVSPRRVTRGPPIPAGIDLPLRAR